MMNRPRFTAKMRPPLAAMAALALLAAACGDDADDDTVASPDEPAETEADINSIRSKT